MEDQLLKTYTKNQLALRNGQDKEEVWCGYKGYIYELTHSRMWARGMHYEHWAGQDLTNELADAPHSADVFKRFDIVGILKEDTV